MTDERVNILVVDDLPDKLLAFRAVLEDLGQNLVMASSGAEALRELLAQDFAVVLLDVNMPDMDGIETAELIRQHGKTRHIPIIFVTAYADEMQTARGYRLGAVDYILSPIVPEILRSKVNVFVDLYRARKDAEALGRAEAERLAARDAEARLLEEGRRKDEFLAMLSHELRNPLAPIRNAVEVLRRVASPEPSLAWACGMIDRQVEHLARMVDDLLDVARITQGKIRLVRQPTELDKVLQLAVETARPLMDARKHTLEVRPPEAPVWLQADFARLAQAIANLLNNAAKYTHEGGRIALAATAHAGEVTISVRDNGIGIERDFLPRVFELFSQAPRASDRSLGGLGVGLTLVHRLVELHGGSVTVESEGPGMGAEFRIRLPCISEVAQPPDDVAARPARSAPGRRVLVVDDNPDAAESTAALLRLEGHEVKAVTDPQWALECCEVFAPAAVVLDIGLPGMDGFELARRMRQLPGLRDAVFIALTGYGQKEDREAAAVAGFQQLLVKPADPAALNAAIAQRQAPASARPAAPPAGR